MVHEQGSRSTAATAHMFWGQSFFLVGTYAMHEQFKVQRREREVMERVFHRQFTHKIAH